MDADKGTANLGMSRCKYTMAKTFEAAEYHFRWNGLIKGNLLVYQNFTLGIFLNIIKGWDKDSRPVIKISYIFSWLSLVLVYFNGYLFYLIVERYTSEKRKPALKNENEPGTRQQKSLTGIGPVMPQKLSKNTEKNSKKKVDKLGHLDENESVIDLKFD